MGTAVLRRLDAETAHRVAIAALKRVPTVSVPVDDPVLATRIGPLALSNPIGLAAGLDKNAEAIGGLSRLGFGCLECGSVTPRPQAGNSRPRLFRLTEDQAIINRMGFNNDGLEAFADRLARRRRGVPVGANLGANKDTEDRVADYVTGLRRVGTSADYVTINISSPNTPGLRALQGRAALDELLGRLTEARVAGVPVFLKIAPDLSSAEIALCVEAARAHGIDALIVSNTTLDRPAGLRSSHAGESGGLSGRPLGPRALWALECAAEASQARLALVAVGGICNGADVLARIRAGACAVQVYSALIYQGPGLIARLKTDLAARMKAEGFHSLAQAVGAR